jgi:predicted SprT family Zn-dependent metalloprotease
MAGLFFKWLKMDTIEKLKKELEGELQREIDALNAFEAQMVLQKISYAERIRFVKDKIKRVENKQYLCKCGSTTTYQRKSAHEITMRHILATLPKKG